MSAVKIRILTVSDTCSQGSKEDKSGPNLQQVIENSATWKEMQIEKCIVPDDLNAIQEQLKKWADDEAVDLVFTTGGTGFAPSDVTPEATKAVLEKEAPGLGLVMLQGSLNVTKLAMLSRPVCGIRKRTLIVNLPGSTKGAQECFEFIKPALPHALDLINERKTTVTETHEQLQFTEPAPAPDGGQPRDFEAHSVIYDESASLESSSGELPFQDFIAMSQPELKAHQLLSEFLKVLPSEYTLYDDSSTYQARNSVQLIMQKGNSNVISWGDCLPLQCDGTSDTKECSPSSTTRQRRTSKNYTEGNCVDIKYKLPIESKKTNCDTRINSSLKNKESDFDIPEWGVHGNPFLHIPSRQKHSKTRKANADKTKLSAKRHKSKEKSRKIITKGSSLEIQNGLKEALSDRKKKSCKSTMKASKNNNTTKTIEEKNIVLSSPDSDSCTMRKNTTTTKESKAAKHTTDDVQSLERPLPSKRRHDSKPAKHTTDDVQSLERPLPSKRRHDSKPAKHTTDDVQSLERPLPSKRRHDSKPAKHTTDDVQSLERPLPSKRRHDSKPAKHTTDDVQSLERPLPSKRRHDSKPAKHTTDDVQSLERPLPSKRRHDSKPAKHTTDDVQSLERPLPSKRRHDSKPAKHTTDDVQSLERPLPSKRRHDSKPAKHTTDDVQSLERPLPSKRRHDSKPAKHTTDDVQSLERPLPSKRRHDSKPAKHTTDDVQSLERPLPSKKKSRSISLENTHIQVKKNSKRRQQTDVDLLQRKPLVDTVSVADKDSKVEVKSHNGQISNHNSKRKRSLCVSSNVPINKAPEGLLNGSCKVDHEKPLVECAKLREIGKDDTVSTSSMVSPAYSESITECSPSSIGMAVHKGKKRRRTKRTRTNSVDDIFRSVFIHEKKGTGILAPVYVDIGTTSKVVTLSDTSVKSSFNTPITDSSDGVSDVKQGQRNKSELKAEKHKFSKRADKKQGNIVRSEPVSTKEYLRASFSKTFKPSETDLLSDMSSNTVATLSSMDNSVEILGDKVPTMKSERKKRTRKRGLNKEMISETDPVCLNPITVLTSMDSTSDSVVENSPKRDIIVRKTETNKRRLSSQRNMLSKHMNIKDLFLQYRANYIDDVTQKISSEDEIINSQNSASTECKDDEPSEVSERSSPRQMMHANNIETSQYSMRSDKSTPSNKTRSHPSFETNKEVSEVCVITSDVESNKPKTVCGTVRRFLRRSKEANTLQTDYATEKMETTRVSALRNACTNNVSDSDFSDEILYLQKGGCLKPTVYQQRNKLKESEGVSESELVLSTEHNKSPASEANANQFKTPLHTIGRMSENEIPSSSGSIQESETWKDSFQSAQSCPGRVTMSDNESASSCSLRSKTQKSAFELSPRRRNLRSFARTRIMSEGSDDCVIVNVEENTNALQHKYVSPHALRIEDEAILISGQWLSDIHINLAQALLRGQFPRLCGLENCGLGSTGGKHFFTPAQNHFVQLFNASGNHWITLTNLCCKANEIRVYDTMYRTVTPDTKAAISLLLLEKVKSSESNVIKVILPTIQKQPNANDCGVYSIAIATSLCLRNDPTKQLYNHLIMRAHLKSCFDIQKMIPFPVKAANAIRPTQLPRKEIIIPVKRSFNVT